MKRMVIGLFAVMASVVGLSAAEHGHLLPVGPTFDVSEPIGKMHAKVCERMLFPESNWIIRYYNDNESVTLGFSIYRRSDRQFRLSVRQAKPELYSVISSAFYNRLHLESALAKVRIEKADNEIPVTLASALEDLWRSMLRKTRPAEKPRPPHIATATAILFAHASNGALLSGKLPSNANAYANFVSFENVIDDLIRSCDQSPKERANLLKQIERKARALSSNE